MPHETQCSDAEQLTQLESMPIWSCKVYLHGRSQLAPLNGHNFRDGEQHVAASTHPQMRLTECRVLGACSLMTLGQYRCKQFELAVVIGLSRFWASLLTIRLTIGLVG